MNKILLIRHGETAWNAERRLQGYLDIPLNDEGERQARLLAEALESESIDVVVSSDLHRARQTAQAVATLRGMPLHVDPALRERCYGGFEGLLYSEIEQRFPAEFAAWQARDVDALVAAHPQLLERDLAARHWSRAGAPAGSPTRPARRQWLR